MKIQIFSIPIIGGEEENKRMNDFLSSHRVVKIQEKLTASDYWTFCISYVDKQPETEIDSKKQKKIDYKDVLNEEDFARFSAMRTVRKKIAMEKAVPPYAIFTDAMLADITKLKEMTIKAISEINGIGEGRATEYGQQMIDAVNALDTKNNENSQESPF